MIARIAWALAIALSQLCSAAEYSPFYAPDTSFASGLHLFQRSSKCANSCASLDSDLCCGKKASCARDDAGNIGCCPERAVCTGIVPGAGSATATPAAGSATAAPGAAITHAIQGTSTLSNQYYPFPVLPTNYADAADCSKSYSSCQAESAKCTGFVEGGGGYGVTVSGAQGQVTQQAAIPAVSAESICSSLSKEACHGLQESQCSTLGGARSSAGGKSFVFGESSNAGPAPSGCAMVYGMGVGVALGLAGGHLL